jgi:hypothetical protein
MENPDAVKSALVSFQFAADAYRLCLEERTKERDDWNWALTNYNLGLVLTDIAVIREASTNELEQAVAAYQSSLEIYDPDSTPTDWADVQDVMGWAMAMLGHRKGDADMVRQARQHMEASFDYYREQDGAVPYFEERLAQIDAWLAAVS